MGVMLSAAPAFAGEEPVEKMPGYVDFSGIKGFEDAEEMVEVYLKRPLLEMVAEMSRDQDPTLYNLLKNVYLIQVRTFSLEGELQKELMELDRRLKALTERLRKEGWEPVVRAREKDEYAEIYIKSHKGKFAGLVVVNNEGKRVALVNIVGSVDLKSLGKLREKFDLPVFERSESPLQSSYTEKHQEEMARSFSLKPGSKVTVRNPRGSIRVRTWDRQEASLKAVKVAWGATSEAARRGVEETEVRTEQRPEGLYIEAVLPERWADLDMGRVEVHLELSLPKKVDLDLANSRGDVRVEDVEGEVSVVNDRGGIALSGIVGGVEVHGDRSPVEVRDIVGDVRISNDRQTTSVRRVDGNVEVVSDRGAVKVADVKGDVSIRNDRQSVWVREVSGDLSVANDRGSVKVEEVGGRVEVRNDRGDITVRLPEDVRHPYTLRTDRNRIEVHVPSGAAVSIYAKAHRGKVVTDFPLDVSIRGRSSIARGELNGGGPEIRLLTDRGDIHILGDGR